MADEQPRPEGEQPAPKKRKAKPDDLALRFAEQYHDRARHDHDLGKWFVWNGHIWRMNGDGLALEWARGICRVAGLRGGEAMLVERYARVDRRLAVTSAVWDADPMLLGTPGGTVDLRDGSLRQADQGDCITRCTAVAPAAEDCALPARWLQFLDEAMQGDQERIRFLQVVAGYCLTGQTIEHALFFNHGGGGNGKSVYANTIRKIMGDYACVAAMETFIHTKGDQHPTSIAALRGARFVVASETERGRSWNESLINRITGGDPMKARFMRQDEFEFQPQLKLWILGNNKPALKHVDDAKRRRFKMVPWLFKPAHKNPYLEDELREEWPQILRWMIDGCLDWQAEGMPLPAAVDRETKRYFEEQDSLRQWMDECCDVEAEHVPDNAAYRCNSSRLFGSWAEWCKRNGEDVGSNKSFSADLASRGFEKMQTRMGVQFLRIRVRHREGDQPPTNGTSIFA